MRPPEPRPFASLVDVLGERAARTPAARAFTFLVDGDDDEAAVTYAELDRQARAIAAVLQGLGAAGERAVLLYPSGLEFVAAFFGCLYAGVTAVPAYPPDPSRLERSLPRLRAIVGDARPRAVLTTGAIAALAQGLGGAAPLFEGLHWLPTDEVPEGVEHAWAGRPIAPEDLALLQYTSGSTGAPKGVMISHGNLFHNFDEIRLAIDPRPGDVIVSWLPLYHDMGLIVKVLYAVEAGLPGVLMSPLHFLQRPHRWLRALTKYGGVFSAAPNFAYELCVRKVTPAMKAGLDLSRWEMAVNAAEPIRKDTVDRFVEAFAPCGFAPRAMYGAYGLAEATVNVAYAGRGRGARVARLDPRAYAVRRAARVAGGEPAGVDVVGCGAVGPTFDARVVDPETRRPLPDGEVGELWLSGPSVGRGYWGRAEETDEAFRARLADDPSGATYLRTYDLAFVEGGELYVAGRLKDVLIVRGRNHYPQDIESTTTAADARLRAGCAAAFSIGGDGGADVAVVVEVESAGGEAGGGEAGEGGGEYGALMQAVARRVAEEHGLRLAQIVLIRRGTIEKTSSGKIQRRATREAFLGGRLAAVATWRAPARDGGAPAGG